MISPVAPPLTAVQILARLNAQSPLAFTPAITMASTLAVTGILTTVARAGIGGSSNSAAILTLGGTNPLTGTTQTGCFVNLIGTTAGTTALRGGQFSIATAAGAYTVADAVSFLALNIGKGAGSTITRATSAWLDPQSNGTNNCGIYIGSASPSYTGNWAIRSESTSASYLAGALNVDGAATFGATSGIVTVGSASNAGFVNMNAAATTQRGFQIQTSGVTKLQFVSSGTESGSDAGCNLQIVARTDAGVLIDAMFEFFRAAGAAVQCYRPFIASGKISGPAATTATASARLPHGTAPTTPVDGDMWTTTAGLYVRINGATVGPLT